MTPFTTQHHQHQPIGPVSIARAKNVLKTCKASGCSELRSNLNPFCSSHSVVYHRYGHPHAHAIKLLYYQGYRKEVEAVFNANSGHAGLVAALDYVTQYFHKAVHSEESSDFRAAYEISRLVRHGVSPREFLVEVCTIWCYLHQNVRALPDQRSEDWAISRAVLRLAPMPRVHTDEAKARGSHGYAMKPRFGALDTIGSHIRQVLAFFLVNIAESVINKEARALVTIQALRSPLVSPTAVYLAEAAAAPTAPTAPAPTTLSPEHSGR